jgi:hypothetical protein
VLTVKPSSAYAIVLERWPAPFGYAVVVADVQLYMSTYRVADRACDVPHMRLCTVQ